MTKLHSGKEQKRIRREKQIKFQEELRLRRNGGAVKSRVCKISKGEHKYVVPYCIGSGRWRYYSLHCLCGRKPSWKEVENIYTIESLEEHSVCQRHGWMRGANKKCWACEMDIDF